ncbi:MAG: hypothetical protein JWN02_173, partial [Acidobacteria bacterium]|nr:hypothetical protein [Acidobacteriota bacterium]
MNRLTRTALAVFAACVAATPLVHAQQPKAQQPKAQQPRPEAPQPAAEQPKLVENIEVRVINVDVVVTDRKGNRINGLTQDDFEVLENNRPKRISNFYEVTSPTAAAPAAPGATAAPAPAPAPVLRADDIPDNQNRRIIFYIDNLTLAPFNRNRVFKQMKEFVTNVMRPGDEAMIATFNRSMKVRVSFTRDPVQLQQTLDVISGESALGVGAYSERKSTEDQINQSQSYDQALATARTYAESIAHDLRTSVESLNALMSTLAGVEGKKVLVMTTEGFPMQPGREMFQYLDEIGRDKGWQGSALLEGMSFDGHDQIRSIARTANANGITVYTVHAAGLAAGSENTAENSRATSFAVSSIALSNSTDSMQLIADMTGGTASIQTNNFGAAFEKIRKDLDSYYSIGYRGDTERVDRQRQLEVRMKNKNYIARSRQTFVEKSTYAEMNDRVIANLLYKTKANELGILVRSSTPIATDDPDLFKVPVEVQIPMSNL